MQCVNLVMQNEFTGGEREAAERRSLSEHALTLIQNVEHAYVYHFICMEIL